MCASITNVQKDYFSILQDFFDEEYRKLEKGKTPNEIANESIKGFTPPVMDSLRNTLYYDLLDHWKRNRESLTGIASSGGVKAYYEAPAGYRPPLFAEDFVRRVALYADSLLIADPILELLRVREVRPDWVYKLTISNAMELLRCRSLAEDSPPIMSVVPTQQMIDKDTNHTLAKLTNSLSLEIVCKLLGKELNSWDEIEAFLCRHDDIDHLLKRIGSLRPLSQPGVSPIMVVTEEYKNMPNYEDNPKATFLYYLLQQGGYSFSTLVNSVTLNSAALAAHPCFDNRVFWDWTMEKHRLDNEKLGTMGTISRDVFVMNVLQLEDFRWLGNVPIDSLREVREDGEMQSMRDMFRKELGEIENVDDDAFEEVANQVKYNLETEFRRHEASLDRLDKKYRRGTLLDLSGIITGSVLAFCAIFYPLAGIIGAGVGGAGFLDLFKRYLEDREVNAQLKKKPIGILFEARS